MLCVRRAVLLVIQGDDSSRHGLQRGKGAERKVPLRVLVASMTVQRWAKRGYGIVDMRDGDPRQIPQIGCQRLRESTDLLYVPMQRGRLEELSKLYSPKPVRPQEIDSAEPSLLVSESESRSKHAMQRMCRWMRDPHAHCRFP